MLRINDVTSLTSRLACIVGLLVLATLGCGDLAPGGGGGEGGAGGSGGGGTGGSSAECESEADCGDVGICMEQAWENGMCIARVRLHVLQAVRLGSQTRCRAGRDSASVRGRRAESTGSNGAAND